MVIVLHEYGARSHYEGLEYLMKKENSSFEHYRLPVSRDILSVKEFLRILRMAFLDEEKRVVIAVAPYSFKILWLLVFSIRHKVYYHTSYVNFENNWVHGSNLTIRLRKIVWGFAMTRVQTFFFVTEASKLSFENIFEKSSEQGVQIVSHSIDTALFVPPNDPGRKSLIFVGRLVEEKGIDRVIEISKALLARDWKITVIGNGFYRSRDLIELDRLDNFEFSQGISRNHMAKYYQKHTYVINASQFNRNTGWEELFGLSILEGMACGCIPLAVNHRGPRQLLVDSLRENLFEDNNHFVCNVLKRLADFEDYNDEDILLLSCNARQIALSYSRKNISLTWQEGLA